MYTVRSVSAASAGFTKKMAARPSVFQTAASSSGRPGGYRLMKLPAAVFRQWAPRNWTGEAASNVTRPWCAVSSAWLKVAVEVRTRVVAFDVHGQPEKMSSQKHGQPRKHLLPVHCLC